MVGMSEDRARHIVERDRVVKAIEGQYDEYRRRTEPGPDAWTKLVDEAREVLTPREG